MPRSQFRSPDQPADQAPLLPKQQAFGYTSEDLKVLMAPMAKPTAARPLARWATTLPSPCSRKSPQLLYNYFKQLFAQVTNPPVDGIREEIIMSMETTIGRRRKLAGADAAKSARQIKLPLSHFEER